MESIIIHIVSGTELRIKVNPPSRWTRSRAPTPTTWGRRRHLRRQHRQQRRQPTLNSYNLPARMRSVWGTGSQDVWAVGDSGVQVRWDGSAWTPVTGKTSQRLNSIWGLSATNILAVGDQGRCCSFDGTN